MFTTTNYHVALEKISELAPDLHSHRGATKYFAWLEPVAEVLAIVYNRDPDDIQEELTKLVKQYQDYED